MCFTIVVFCTRIVGNISPKSEIKVEQGGASMHIANNILKYYLRNVLFITGTAYAGKSTMVRMLAEKYNLVHCGENYHAQIPAEVLSLTDQPNLNYFKTMKDWQEFIHRTPEEYTRWIVDSSKEAAEIEVAMLISLSQERKVIADTNIPIDDLKQIAGYHQVAVMLSPQAMSVDYFFERDDAEKVFLKEQIQKAKDPIQAMQNFRACLASINSQERYDRLAHSGFFTLVREDAEADTRQEVLDQLAKHFGLV